MRFSTNSIREFSRKINHQFELGHTCSTFFMENKQGLTVALHVEYWVAREIGQAAWREEFSDGLLIAAFEVESLIEYPGAQLDVLYPS